MSRMGAVAQLESKLNELDDVLATSTAKLRKALQRLSADRASLGEQADDALRSLSEGLEVGWRRVQSMKVQQKRLEELDLGGGGALAWQRRQKHYAKVLDKLASDLAECLQAGDVSQLGQRGEHMSPATAAPRSEALSPGYRPRPPKPEPTPRAAEAPAPGQGARAESAVRPTASTPAAWEQMPATNSRQPHGQQECQSFLPSRQDQSGPSWAARAQHAPAYALPSSGAARAQGGGRQPLHAGEGPLGARAPPSERAQAKLSEQDIAKLFLELATATKAVDAHHVTVSATPQRSTDAAQRAFGTPQRANAFATQRLPTSEPKRQSPASAARMGAPPPPPSEAEIKALWLICASASGASAKKRPPQDPQPSSAYAFRAAPSQAQSPHAAAAPYGHSPLANSARPLVFTPNNNPAHSPHQNAALTRAHSPHVVSAAPQHAHASPASAAPPPPLARQPAETNSLLTLAHAPHHDQAAHHGQVAAPVHASHQEAAPSRSHQHAPSPTPAPSSHQDAEQVHGFSQHVTAHAAPNGTGFFQGHGDDAHHAPGSTEGAASSYGGQEEDASSQRSQGTMDEEDLETEWLKAAVREMSLALEKERLLLAAQAKEKEELAWGIRALEEQEGSLDGPVEDVGAGHAARDQDWDVERVGSEGVSEGGAEATDDWVRREERLQAQILELEEDLDAAEAERTAAEALAQAARDRADEEAAREAKASEASSRRGGLKSGRVDGVSLVAHELAWLCSEVGAARRDILWAADLFEELVLGPEDCEDASTQTDGAEPTLQVMDRMREQDKQIRLALTHASQGDLSPPPPSAPYALRSSLGSPAPDDTQDDWLGGVWEAERLLTALLLRTVHSHSCTISRMMQMKDSPWPASRKQHVEAHHPPPLDRRLELSSPAPGVTFQAATTPVAEVAVLNDIHKKMLALQDELGRRWLSPTRAESGRREAPPPHENEVRVQRSAYVSGGPTQEWLQLSSVTNAATPGSSSMSLPGFMPGERLSGRDRDRELQWLRGQLKELKNTLPVAGPTPRRSMQHSTGSACTGWSLGGNTGTPREPFGMPGGMSQTDINGTHSASGGMSHLPAETPRSAMPRLIRGRYSMSSVEESVSKDSHSTTDWPYAQVAAVRQDGGQSLGMKAAEPQDRGRYSMSSVEQSVSKASHSTTDWPYAQVAAARQDGGQSVGMKVVEAQDAPFDWGEGIDIMGPDISPICKTVVRERQRGRPSMPSMLFDSSFQQQFATPHRHADSSYFRSRLEMPSSYI